MFFLRVELLFCEVEALKLEVQPNIVKFIRNSFNILIGKCLNAGGMNSDQPRPV